MSNPLNGLELSLERIQSNCKKKAIIACLKASYYAINLSKPVKKGEKTKTGFSKARIEKI